MIILHQARPKRATEGALLARDWLDGLEVRSFQVEHMSALWHLDFHHASRNVLTRAGTWVKPMLIGVLDVRARLICHLQWYLDETTESLAYGRSQAVCDRAEDAHSASAQPVVAIWEKVGNLNSGNDSAAERLALA